LGEGRTDQSVEPCPYQTGDGTWIPKAYVFRRVDGKIVRTEVHPVEPIILDSAASETAWRLAVAGKIAERYAQAAAKTRAWWSEPYAVCDAER
jgi:hypothetical protein